MEVALKIENLSYAYKGNWSFKRVKSLHEFSLDVFSGEAFGFLGHNGAGKTTTIKCILNLIKPSSGQISIFGKDFKNRNSRALIGYIPEHPYFYDNLSVTETLNMYANLYKLAPSEINSRVTEVITKVGLEHKTNAMIRSLSKGLMQRVALAQAIIHQPKLLILDEPFSGLDPIGRKEFRDIFFDLKKSGTTLFISSHILSDVEYLCDRVSILVKGKLKGVYEVENIPNLTQPSYEILLDGKDLVEEPNIQPAPVSIVKLSRALSLKYEKQSEAEQALKYCLDKQISVVAYEKTSSNLEDLFLKLVNDNK